MKKERTFEWPEATEPGYEWNKCDFCKRAVYHFLGNMYCPTNMCLNRACMDCIDFYPNNEPTNPCPTCGEIPKIKWRAR